MRNRSSLFRFMGFAALMVCGCASTPRSTMPSRSAATDERAALRARAEVLWKAKVAEDWEHIFELQDPHSRQGWDKTDFVTWSKDNEPFKIQDFELHSIQADGDMGWVEVRYNTLIRRFEALPPRDATLWQKWRRVDGVWYPVPLRELVSYPEPPARRNALEEDRLRARFAASWRAKKAGDHHASYQFIDPYDQPRMPEVAFVDMQQLLEYRTCEVKWVEVVNDLGRIHVVYTRKVTDPSLSKLPVETVAEIEDWIKVDGEWYRDLARASGPTPGETHDAS